MQPVKERTKQLFFKCNKQIQADLKAMYADHAAKGLLASGSTIKAAIRIYEHCHSEALSEACKAVSLKTEKRGRSWKRYVNGVREVLESRFKHDENFLIEPLRLTRSAPESTAGKAAKRLLLEAQDRLRKQLDDFAEGWTAPTLKSWNERKPLFYAILLIAISAIIGEVTKPIIQELLPSLKFNAMERVKGIEPSS